MIFLQLSEQLESLNRLLLKLNNIQYNHAVKHLGNASIGGHTRHIIELLQCAVKGHYTGEVDYINRHRGHLLETDRMLASSTLQQLQHDIVIPDKQLLVLVEQWGELSKPLSVTTTYFRELVYNTEHTIHHLALIKVALIEMKLDVVDMNFGLAYSTMKYQASLQQA